MAAEGCQPAKIRVAFSMHIYVSRRSGGPTGKDTCGLLYAFLRVPALWGANRQRHVWPFLCIFTCFLTIRLIECMYFYVVFAYLGGNLYAFLRGIRIPGGHFVCIRNMRRDVYNPLFFSLNMRRGVC